MHLSTAGSFIPSVQTVTFLTVSHPATPVVPLVVPLDATARAVLPLINQRYYRLYIQVLSRFLVNEIPKNLQGKVNRLGEDVDRGLLLRSSEDQELWVEE